MSDPPPEKPRKRYAPLKVTLSITGMPEVLSIYRRDMADKLRAMADAEPSPAMAKRLREIAAEYETGL